MSNHQNGVELVKIYNDLTGKISFMLITASTASIAYILTQIKDETWTSLMYFPLLSLILLGLSFLCGCNSLNSKASVLHNNAYILQSLKNPNCAEEIMMAMKEVETSSNKTTAYNNIQYITFLFGALAYAIFVISNIILK